MSMRSEPMVRVEKCEHKDSLFTPEVRAEIDAWIAKYPEGWQQSACMPALTIVQDMNGGHLTRELMDQVADYLDMPPISVYEVATFYARFDVVKEGDPPPPPLTVRVCDSIACEMAGARTLLAEVMHREVEIRVRPGYFPFVEPGGEVAGGRRLGEKAAQLALACDPVLAQLGELRRLGPHSTPGIIRLQVC